MSFIFIRSDRVNQGLVSLRREAAESDQTLGGGNCRVGGGDNSGGGRGVIFEAVVVWPGVGRPQPQKGRKLTVNLTFKGGSDNMTNLGITKSFK